MNAINVVTYVMPKDTSKTCSFFASIVSSPSTLIFLSPKAYEHIKSKTIPRVYFSLEPLYTDGLVCLEKFLLPAFPHKCEKDLPKSVIIIFLEDEKTVPTPETSLISANSISSMVNDILWLPSSIFIMTGSAYKRIMESANLISSYCNRYRVLTEDGYISLKSFNGGLNYLVEEIDFANFKKNFSIQNIPKTLHFIV